MSFGSRLREFRKELGFTQDIMAEKIGMQKRGYISYEMNERECGFDKLAQLAHLGADLHYLLTGEISPSLHKSAQIGLDRQRESGEISPAVADHSECERRELELSRKVIELQGKVIELMEDREPGVRASAARRQLSSAASGGNG